MSEVLWYEKFESGMLWLDHRIGDLSRWLRRPFKYPYTTYFGLAAVAIVLCGTGAIYHISWPGLTGMMLIFVCFIATLPPD